jgi:uncharacterized protein YprB with RNaseH-like and TPR domain
VSKLRDKLQRLTSLTESAVMRQEPAATGLHAAASEDDTQLTPAVEAREQDQTARSARLVGVRPPLDRRANKRAPAPPPRPASRGLFGSRAEPHASIGDDDGPFASRARSYAFASSSLPGECHESPHGPLRSVRTEYAEDHCHGSVPVTSALEAMAADIAVLALDPSLAEIDFSRALYIDTETTGLSGGAGTLPFLIGMAWFESSTLCVEQMLLEKPGLEGPMLRRLAERMALASAIVSFNGKSFDWPLLRTRFVLTRVALPSLPPHLDLLHCARRVYKRRLGSVRLVHLEEQVLGFTRVDDIAGELIPDTYLGYLRGHVPAGALSAIVDHNRNDLVALAALLGEIARRFCAAEPQQDARDQLGFAGVAARAQNELGTTRAFAFAAGAAEADIRGELVPEAHCLQGELCLRAGNSQGAERAFLRAIEAAFGRSEIAGRAHLALAKLYEHQLKRFEAALHHAQAARELEGEAASERRVARLARKTGAAQQRLSVDSL